MIRTVLSDTQWDRIKDLVPGKGSDPHAHAVAKKEKRSAQEALTKPEALMGAVLERSQSSLACLDRHGGAVERSLYRALEELEKLKAKQRKTVSVRISSAEAKSEEPIPAPGSAE